MSFPIGSASAHLSDWIPSDLPPPVWLPPGRLHEDRHVRGMRPSNWPFSDLRAGGSLLEDPQRCSKLSRFSTLRSTSSLVYWLIALPGQLPFARYPPFHLPRRGITSLLAGILSWFSCAFRQHLLGHLLVQAQMGDEALQLAILLLELPEPARLRFLGRTSHRKGMIRRWRATR